MALIFGVLLLLVLAGLAGPLLSATRRPLLPVLVGELAAGALVGRTGFGWLQPAQQPLPAFMTLGFAMLMLQAGSEVDIRSPDLRSGAARGALAFAGTLIIGVPIGFALETLSRSGNPFLLAVLIAGSSAAVAFPTIQEHGLTGPAVAVLLAWITLADATTALLMPLTLSGGGKIPRALAGDVAIVAAAAGALLLARRLFQTPLADAGKKMSKQRGWALQLRLALVLLLALAVIAETTGASLLIAGFAAGIVLRQFQLPHRLEHQLVGVASGFFVPAFFVLLGATLDLRGLVRSPSAIALALAMAAGAALAHLAAAAIATRQQRIASGLLSSAQLGLPAAAASLGLATRALSAPVAAALVAGGCLTLIPATVGAARLAGLTRNDPAPLEGGAGRPRLPGGGELPEPAPDADQGSQAR